MQKNLYTITKKDLFDLFGRLSENYRVIVPYGKGDKLYFDAFDPRREESIELGGIRQSQPIKSFINPPREKVSSGPRPVRKPVIIAGAKGCDLSSFVLQDFVFKEGDYPDPFYVDRRDQALIISCDCTYAKETCFCVAMDGAPFPRAYFDLNLTPIDDNFLVETGSEKGAGLINSFRTFFKAANPRLVDLRQSSRERVTKEVRHFIDRRGTKNTTQIKGAVAAGYNNVELWKDFASTCVECGACNLVCPTCHCFILFDEKNEAFAKRYKTWDACLYNTFARVAGGSNPRRHLYERLRNRFEKKFDFFPKVLDYFACTGCGRCIEACPGDIDLREVLKGLISGKWNKPPND